MPKCIKCKQKKSYDEWAFKKRLCLECYVTQHILSKEQILEKEKAKEEEKKPKDERAITDAVRHIKNRESDLKRFREYSRNKIKYDYDNFVKHYQKHNKIQVIKNRAKRVQGSRDHYLINKETILKEKKQWYIENREKDLKRKKEYYQKNKERLQKVNREKKKKEYQTNKETLKLRAQTYRYANSELVRARGREADRKKKACVGERSNKEKDHENRQRNTS